MVSAFQKIEKELERKKQAEAKELATSAERKNFERIKKDLERKKRRQMLLVYLFLCGFLGLLVFGVQKSRVEAKAQGKTFASWAGDTFKEMVDGIFVEEADCSKPENWKLEYCIEKKKRTTDQQWRNISFNKDGKESAFAVGRTK